jgi:outer membrane protein OmpA-like peptidoglycan-associated protein
MLAWLIPFLTLFEPTDSISVVSIDPEINAYRTQYFPQYLPNQHKLYFTVRKELNSDEEIYVANWQDGHFETPLPITELNQENNEGTPTFSADGLYMIFSGCEYPNSFGGCDLYETRWIDGSWTKPKNVGFRVNSHDWEGQPHLSSDGKLLFFASDRPGGLGKRDLWLSEKDEMGQWKFPVNLGPKINSPEDEQGPYLLLDKKRFIYSSNKKGGMGGLDFYQTPYPTNEQVPKAISSINTDYHDAGITPSETREYYYISRRINKPNQDLGIVRMYIPDSIFTDHSPSIKIEQIKFDDIEFNNNAWQLDSIPTSLQLLAKYLQANPSKNVEIQGHTDEVGTEEKNILLSEKRALSIKLYLMQLHISGERIKTKGLGNTMPKIKNPTALERKQNRRIEIMVH